MSNYWVGQRIRLRRSEPEDWPDHHRWNADMPMMRDLQGAVFPRSAASARAFAEESATRDFVGDAVHLEIEVIGSGDLAGSIGTNRIDQRNGTFSYGIGIDEQFRRQGFAGEAIGLILDFYFDELRYQKCTAEVASWNVASIALQLSLGFVEEGRLRRMAYSGGEYHDSLYFGITAEEWRARRTGR